MTQLEIAQQIEIEKLREENELMRKLSTVDGFILYYFSECKKYKTNIGAFNEVNKTYYKLFSEYRYSDFDSFRKMVNYHRNKNKTKK